MTRPEGEGKSAPGKALISDGTASRCLAGISTPSPLVVWTDHALRMGGLQAGFMHARRVARVVVYGRIVLLSLFIIYPPAKIEKQIKRWDERGTHWRRSAGTAG